MQNRRVRYLLDPEEPLTIPRHVIPQVLRVGLASEVLGLPEDALVLSPAISVPLPRYPDDKPLRGTAGVRPSALRYPFMWLPASLRERYELADDKGDAKLESDTVWALRVTLEMFTSGAFNAATGGWIDILALHDLDVEDPEVAERVSRWWNGEDDEILDAIDISEMFEVDNPDDDQDWAIVSASSLDETFRKASYCLAGFDISALCDMLESGNARPFGNANIKDSVRALINVSMAEFIDDRDIFTAFETILEHSLRRFPSDRDILREIIPEIRDAADIVSGTYLPYLHGVMESDVAAQLDEQTEAERHLLGQEAERRDRQHGRRRAEQSEDDAR